MGTHLDVLSAATEREQSMIGKSSMPVDGNLLMLTIDEQSNVNVFVIIDCHRLSISSIIVLFF